MAGFWNRRKNNMANPPQYIQTTDTVSRPQTILMSLLIIFVVGALIFGLFLGIKWGVDKINSDDGPKQAPISTSPATGDNGSNTVVTPSTPGQIAGGSTATNSTPQTTGSASSTTASSNSSTSTATNIPNTGPENLVAVFIASTIIGALGYRTLLLRKLN